MASSSLQQNRKASSSVDSSLPHSHDSSSFVTTTERTEVIINVYDLLPPGRLSTLLWTLGSSLLHSGVVLHSREYAFGGHNKPHTTGVYYTRPLQLPPGGTHRVSISQGYTHHSPAAIQQILQQVSAEFQGQKYHLLKNNCNHFTQALVEALMGSEGKKRKKTTTPAWLNRAAGIGLALPCMVPREWVQGPDVDSAEGQLVVEAEEDDCDDGGIPGGGRGGGGSVMSTRAVYKYEEEDDEDSDSDERVSMLESERHVRLRAEQRRSREEELRMRKERRLSSRMSGVSTSTSSTDVKGGGNTTVTKADEDEDDDEEEEAVVVEQISLAGGKRIMTLDEPPPRYVKRTDSAGRKLRVPERAPLPRAAVMVTAASKT